MKKKLLPFLLLLAGIIVKGQYDPAALAILDAMSGKYRNYAAYSAVFTQNLKNPTAGLDESLSGKITVKGNKYLLEVSGQMVYNNGVDVYTYNAELNEVTIASYEAGDEEISLNNIYDIYKTGFKYVIFEVKDDINFIDLDPVDRSDKSYFKIRMEINTNNDLKAFSVYEPSGNVYRYKLDGLSERKDINDDYFVFNPDDYEDIEVVDFR